MNGFNTLKYAFLIALGALVLQGCQDLYLFEHESEEEILVVEGLVTNDEWDLHTVLLSWASPYGGPRHRLPVTGAVVTLRDDRGIQDEMVETLPGRYRAPYRFAAEVGETYRLHILLEDGREYESEPQLMVEPLDLDRMVGAYGVDYQYTESAISERLIQHTFPGAHLFLDLEDMREQTPRFRFSSKLYIQWVELVDEGVTMPGTYDFCWIRTDITNLVARSISDPAVTRLKTAFVPRDGHVMHFYNFPRRDYNQPRVVIHNFYSLNEDSHNYYTAKYDQLGAEGKIFDPIAAQLPTNIRCLTDPDELVLGFFEASTLERAAYQVRMNQVEETVSLTAMPLTYDRVPVTGCVREFFPDFWLF